MNFFKNIWNKIKKPHGFYLVLFYILFFLLVSATLTLVILKPDQSVFHYLMYALSAVSLTYFVYTIVILAPKIKHKIIIGLKKHKFTNALLTDFGYRTLIFSGFTFLLNLAYVIFMGVLGIMSKSAWYISITVYYLVLSLIKGLIIYSKNKQNNTENSLKTYRTCGIMFIFLTIALSGIIVLIYTSNMFFDYAGLMIYVVATYTFYNLAFSIINIIKAKKYENFYIQGIKNVNLASALVSIVVLQVAMFQAFSPLYNTSIANGLTGAGISAIILTIGIYMIVRSNKNLKKLAQCVDNSKLTSHQTIYQTSLGVQPAETPIKVSVNNKNTSKQTKQTLSEQQNNIELQNINSQINNENSINGENK